jgi:uncharacterized protein (DUF885 family)
MRLMFAAGLLALVSACGPTTPAAPTAEEIAKASADLTVWLDAEYEESLQLSPMQLTMQGRKDQNDKLDDMSEGARDRNLAWVRESVTEMKATFDPAKLDEESKTSFDMWALQLEQADKSDKFRRHPYTFIRDSVPVFLPAFMINFHEVSEKADMDAYMARLAAFPTAIDQVIDQAKLSAEAGVRPPLFSYEQVIGEAGNVITGAPFGAGADSPLLADVKTKVKALVDGGKITAEEGAAFEATARETLTTSIKPAYERIIAWLESDKANASPDAKGVGVLPDGAAYYNVALEQHTTTTMTADEIHELGLKEVARIRAEMEAIREKVGFQGDLPAMFKHMRESKEFYAPNTDAGRAAYLAQADECVAGMRTKLPEYFGIMPKADLVVKRVESFREEAGGVQHYFPPSIDGSRPGIYYVHLLDTSAMPLWDLESTTYHEALPGHHMQIAIAQELTGIPKFRTQYNSTAYSEGWALYTEILAKEMGDFYADPYSDMGRLNNEMWRAVRLVVDTGIHSKGWTQDQAVQYFMDNSPTPEDAIRSEIRRYFVWPGQATSYKIGMIKIQELRALAQKELGDRFTMPGFHDTVLSGGALPLPVLEARVKRWIDKVKAQ